MKYSRSAQAVNRISRKHLLLLLSILSLGAFLRLYHLSTLPPGLYADEGVEGCDALTALETHHFSVFYLKDNGREGLYADTVAVSIAAFGNTALAVRFPAALFGTAPIAGVYLLATEWFSTNVGLLSAFFTATSLWHIHFSRIGFRGITAPCVFVFSVWTFAVALRRAQQDHPHWLWPAIAGAVYGLGFYTYIPYRITPLLMLAYLIYFSRRANGKIGRSIAAFLATTILAVSPLLVYFATHRGSFSDRSRQVSALSSPHPLAMIASNFGKTVSMLYLSGDLNWRHNVPGAPQLFWPVALLMTVGIFAIAAHNWLQLRFFEGRDFERWLLISWLILGALPAVFSNEGVPHALRSILMVPAAVILAAIGASALAHYLSSSMNRSFRSVITVGCALLITAATFHGYFITWANSPFLPWAFDAENTQIVKAIGATPSSRPKVIGTPEGSLASDTVEYLSNTVTAQEQKQKNITYYTSASPEVTHHPELGSMAFCDALKVVRPDAMVFCLNTDGPHARWKR